MNSVNSKKIMINAVMTGAVAAALTKFYFGDVDYVKYFNMEISAPIATGLGCAVGSVVSDLTSEVIIKRLGVTNQIMNGASMAVNVSVAGASSGIVLYLGGLPVQNMIPSIALGSVSKLGGDYANEKLFSARDGILGPII